MLEASTGYADEPIAAEKGSREQFGKRQYKTDNRQPTTNQPSNDSMIGLELSAVRFAFQELRG
jgi:hypothetical protein